jgi:hypothetical protein
MYNMMNSGMMWTMNLFWVLLVVLCLLGIAVLVKYVLFHSRQLADGPHLAGNRFHRQQPSPLDAGTGYAKVEIPDERP